MNDEWQRSVPIQNVLHAPTVIGACSSEAMSALRVLLEKFREGQTQTHCGFVSVDIGYLSSSEH